MHMNNYLVPIGIVCALSGSAGCLGATHGAGMPESSTVQQASLSDGRRDAASLWRQEATELRRFADRHEVEAEILLRRDLPQDIRLGQQRRAIAQDLRVAAAQAEQQAVAAERALAYQMAQPEAREIEDETVRRAFVSAVYGGSDR